MAYQELDDKPIEQEMGKNLADLEARMDKLHIEQERTVNEMMMALIVERALKETAASHKKEMDQMKDTLRLEDTETMNMMENALQNDSEVKDRLTHRLRCKNIETMNMMEKMVVNALKMSDATHGREMDQLKNTLQLNDSQTLNMMAQMSAAAHEREMHYENMRVQDVPECNIM